MRNNPSNWTPTKAGGFTITEMVVVIAIILVVTAAGIPTFMPFFRGRALRGAADIVKQVCIQARSMAVQDRIEYLVVFSNEGGDEGPYVALVPALNLSDLPTLEARESLARRLPGQVEAISDGAHGLSIAAGEQWFSGRVNLPEGVEFEFTPDTTVYVVYAFLPSGAVRTDPTWNSSDALAFSLVEQRDDGKMDFFIYPATGRVNSEHPGG